MNKTIKKIDPDVVFMHGIADFKDLNLLKKKRSIKYIETVICLG